MDSEPILIIGVISDIHGRLSNEAYEALQGSDYILCAGDIENRMVLTELETIAPTICVRGNCDRYDLGPRVKDIASPLLGGVRFRMVHRPEDIGTVPDDVKVVIHGHTHVPREEYGKGGVLFLNPGSPSRPRGGSVKSVARLFVEDGVGKSVEFVEVDADIQR